MATAIDDGGTTAAANPVAAGSLLRNPAFRRLWASVLLGNFGGQVTLLALPLTAAVLLHATPLQMGLLTALEIAPFALLSLPAGVWLDRVRKLPVVVAGELALAAAVGSVPLAWVLGVLSLPLLCGAAFVIGCVNTVAGSASQVVLTQVVPRARLVEAHAKNALAGSLAEVAGPGAAGALVRLFGAPLALLVDALLLLASALVLRGVRTVEAVPAAAGAAAPSFGGELRAGLRFVREHALLRVLALTVGAWQACNYGVAGVQILYASRELGLSPQAIGGCFVVLGIGTVLGSVAGDACSRRLGPGPALLLGFALCGAGWALPALAAVAMPRWPAAGVAAFALMLLLAGAGTVLVFIHFLALRQSATPPALLGRMTSTMRWLILLPAGPGALLAGALGDQVGLRAVLGGAGACALLLALAAWQVPLLRRLRQLPAPAG